MLYNNCQSNHGLSDYNSPAQSLTCFNLLQNSMNSSYTFFFTLLKPKKKIVPVIQSWHIFGKVTEK